MIRRSIHQLLFPFAAQDIDRGSFDPWQRFELAFQIVVTEGFNQTVIGDWEDWLVSYAIDGVDLGDVSQEYGVNFLTRPSCNCTGSSCTNMPSNVEQVLVEQLLIPSHRTLHNGYCANTSEPWMFSYEHPSVITVTASKLVSDAMLLNV